MRFQWLVALVLGFALTAGCGWSPPSAPPPEPDKCAPTDGPTQETVATAIQGLPDLGEQAWNEVTRGHTQNCRLYWVQVVAGGGTQAPQHLLFFDRNTPLGTATPGCAALHHRDGCGRRHRDGAVPVAPRQRCTVLPDRHRQRPLHASGRQAEGAGPDPQRVAPVASVRIHTRTPACHVRNRTLGVEQPARRQRVAPNRPRRCAPGAASARRATAPGCRSRRRVPPRTAAVSGSVR